MANASDPVNTLARGRVLVVGDVMVDHYVSGRVSRVSDEAPVPIIEVGAERWTPGGAANVAANIRALGGAAVLLGVVGEDPIAAMLDGMLAKFGGGGEQKLVPDPNRPTTIKTRYMGGQHQIVRVDRERRSILPEAAETKLLEGVAALAPQAGAVMISDYAKGVLTDRVLKAAIAAGKAAKKPVVVDPKRADWAGYAGADLITPNRRELSLATGIACSTDAECDEAAAQAIAKTGAAILLTRSEKGMTLYRKNHPPLALPAKAREVFDVSGAGDTVAAVTALGLASGLSIETSVGLANVAAGIVVAKRGTAVALPDEIAAELGHPHTAGGRGALSLEETVRLRGEWGRAGLKVGFANGCFDILHPGHVALIRAAAEACDRLIVALNSDASVKRLKGPARPAQTETARAEVMAALRGVDAVVIFGEDTPLEAITRLEPDVLVKGADYTEDKIVGADIVKAKGGRIVRVELVEGQSTTRIIGPKEA
jgi:D-beta-D-heptose 7-phosphate kinase/D-beta-D-heptose 1-phosphate adenosyltransferase